MYASHAPGRVLVPHAILMVLRGIRLQAVLTLCLALPSIASADSSATVARCSVTAHVRTSSGANVGNAYIGLVPEWSPLSRPAAEQVAEKGLARFDVYPGEYWLIAGAPGYAASTVGPFTVSGPAAELSIELSPLAPASGSVRDARGEPIAGARISTLNGAVLAPLGKASALAANHLERDWKTTTDQDGAWTLELASGDVPLVVEAQGLAAEWIVRKAAATAPTEVSLQAGASLTITTDREDAALVLTLSRADSGEQVSLPADKQPLIWARSAASKTIAWDSLPPGRYTVYAKYSNPLYFNQVATALVEVSLDRSQHRAVNVVLPPAKSPASGVAILMLRDFSRDDLGDELAGMGRVPHGPSTSVPMFVEDVMGGCAVHLDVRGVEPPYFVLTKERFVATIPSLAKASPGRNSTPILGFAFERADVHLQLRSAVEGMALPESGLARLSECEAGTDASVPIEIRPSGFARFSAPAGCSHIVLELDPFESVIQSVALQRGDQYLGEFTLQAAATADIHVTRVPGDEVVAGANVRLLLMPEGERRSGAIVVSQATSDEKGWAKFRGVPPFRELRAVAETAEGDLSDYVPISAEPLEHKVLDPLGVKAPATLVIDAKIDPAVLARFPSATILAISATPSDPVREAERKQRDDPEGLPTLQRLHAGSWQISAVARVGSSWGLFDLETVDIEAGEVKRVTTTVKPNVFEGRVTAGGKPVHSKVTVDLDGNPIGFITDENGLFQAVVAHPGVYSVWAARLSNQGNVMPLGDVAFVDPTRRIELELPGGSNVTVNVTGAGSASAGSLVVSMSRLYESGEPDSFSERGRLVDGAGRVRFEDVSPGTWTFAVKDRASGKSAKRSITLDGSGDQTVELELGEGASIRGKVRDLRGVALPMAAVDCIFVDATGGPSRSAALTDSSGNFEIELIEPAPRSVMCSAFGPNRGVDGFRLQRGEENLLTLPGSAGTLQIADWREVANKERLWLVSSDGRAVSLGAAARRVSAPGSSLNLAGLGAGQWKVVRADTMQSLLALANGLGSALPLVSEASVKPGQTEVVRFGSSLTSR